MASGGFYGRGGRGRSILDAMKHPARKPGQQEEQAQAPAAAPVTPQSGDATPKPPAAPITFGRGGGLLAMMQKAQPSSQPGALAETAPKPAPAMPFTMPIGRGLGGMKELLQKAAQGRGMPAPSQPSSRPSTAGTSAPPPAEPVPSSTRAPPQPSAAGAAPSPAPPSEEMSRLAIYERREAPLPVQFCLQFDLFRSSFMREQFTFEKFGLKIGRSTVSDILRDSAKWLAVPSNDVSTSRNRKPKQEELENALFLWFTDVRSRNVMLNDELMKTQAKVLGDRLGVVDFAYSTGWLNRFKQRHGIKNHKVHGESASVNPQTVSEGRKSLQEVLADFNPCDIFNCDETGLFYKIEPNSTLSTGPVSGKKQPKDRLTVMLTVNATGTEKLKPLVIHKFNRPRCFGRTFDPSTVCHWYVNTRAWMTSLIFRDWLVNFDRQMRLQRRHVILLLDNAPSHATCQLTNVTCHFLPPNTTSHIQPLDAGIIKNFKLKYKKQQMKLYLDNAQSETPQALDVKRALLFIRTAWNEVKQETIINCWRHTKILPSDEPSTADLATDTDATIAEISTVVTTLYGPNTPAEEFLNADSDLPCEESLSDDSIIDMVKMKNESSEPTDEEIDDSEEPTFPKASTVKSQLDGIASFVEHHLDTFNVADLDALNKIKDKIREITTKT